MLNEKYADINFSRNYESLNRADIFYPKKKPDIIFRYNNTLEIFCRNGRAISVNTPRLTLFSYLKGLKKGRELEEMMREEFKLNYSKKELKTLLHTVARIYLAKTGKIKLKALDIEVELENNKFFLDMGYFKDSFFRGDAGRCFFHDIAILQKKTGEVENEFRFSNIYYRKKKDKINDLMIRAHEETHALILLGKLNSFEEEVSKYDSTTEMELFDEEMMAYVGSGLALIKNGIRDYKTFSIIEFAKRLDEAVKSTVQATSR